MPINHRALVLRLVASELQRVDRLTELVDTAVEEEMEELRALGGNEDDGIEFYADEAYELSDISSLFTQLSVIALYAVVEIRTKSLLATKASPAEVEEAFKFTALKKLFCKVSGQPLNSIAQYDAIDELRCLNNAIKHSGTVGTELAAFTGWRPGDKIRDVRPAVARLRPSVPVYLAAVSAAL